MNTEAIRSLYSALAVALSGAMFTLTIIVPMILGLRSRRR